MRYWFDTEFFEHDRTVELISIGIVAEDGRELYRENAAFDWARVEALALHPSALVNQTPNWLFENVKPHLVGESRAVSPADLRAAILEFVGVESKPEFWAYYADYDWVVFAQTIGRMIDLPRSWPKYCRDLKQWADQLGGPRLPEQTSTEHLAIADARWNRDAWRFLTALDSSGVDRIRHERAKQIGYWTNEHDDTHEDGSLNFAAQAYAQSALEPGLWPCEDAPAPPTWPWGADHWRPTGYAIGDLVKAGALIAAEIDRLERGAPASREQGVAVGCICPWDDVGNPVGGHRPRCPARETDQPKGT